MIFELTLPAAIVFLIYIVYVQVLILKFKFKCAYYETRLENRGIDIDHIKNISFIGMFKI